MLSSHRAGRCGISATAISLWLLPGPRRQFALVGDYGQRVCVDPASKLVMVQTALEDTPEFWRLWSALIRQFGAE